MDKITSLRRRKTLGENSAFLKRGEELLKLAFRQGVKEGLEENDGLPQTGIQIVVRGIEDIPITVGVQGVAGEDFLRSGLKVGSKLLDELGEGGDFVEELRPSGKEHHAENTVETREALAAGILKILGIKRSEVRRSAGMPRVQEHGLE
jgi:hypothetical protein